MDSEQEQLALIGLDERDTDVVRSAGLPFSVSEMTSAREVKGLSHNVAAAIVHLHQPSDDGRDVALEILKLGIPVALLAGAETFRSLIDTEGASVATLVSPLNADELRGLFETGISDLRSHTEKQLRFRRSVTQAAALSGSTGMPVSFVRIGGSDDLNSAASWVDELRELPGLTAVVPEQPVLSGIALLLNAAAETVQTALSNRFGHHPAVIDVRGGDTLESLLGRSSCRLYRPTPLAGAVPKVVVALAKSDQQTLDIVTTALTSMDLEPVVWNPQASTIDDASEGNVIALVVDLGLPAGEGPYLIEQVRSKHPTRSLPALSMGDAMSESRVSFEHGADDFVLPPYTVQEIQAAMGRLISPLPDSPRRLGGHASVDEMPKAFARAVQRRLLYDGRCRVPGLGILRVAHTTTSIKPAGVTGSTLVPPSKELTFESEASSSVDTSG